MRKRQTTRSLMHISDLLASNKNCKDGAGLIRGLHLIFSAPVEDLWLRRLVNTQEI